MNPVIPHFSSECIELLNANLNIVWPKVDNKNLLKENINYVIQINGKTRQIIEEKINFSKDDLISLIKNRQTLSKYIKSETVIKRVIFVPNKLLNLIL